MIADGKSGSARYGWMMDTATDLIKWTASLSGMTAALIVSLDLGRRATGFGFVIFVASSIAWFAGAYLTEDWALGTQNGVLLAINVLGVYRYLVRQSV
ncbi:hypothetical protein [Sphingomonas sp. Leaf339]|uniref:hypothetical protein n=1 Tax=Sphingomonas sp. Leaf339 TaxID=1736343 RepID=UPI000A685DF2|nr:hypothetical protein [Sphingomonas sp. Leaf339]